MKCVYCGHVFPDVELHWTECESAPEFVRLQALAEKRGARGSGQKLQAPCLGSGGLPMFCNRNHIDRGEPLHDLREQPTDGAR